MHRVLKRNRLFLTSRYDTLNFKILYSSTNDRIRCTQAPCTPGVRKVPLLCLQSLKEVSKIQLTLTFNVGKITRNRELALKEPLLRASGLYGCPQLSNIIANVVDIQHEN